MKEQDIFAGLSSIIDGVTNDDDNSNVLPQYLFQSLSEVLSGEKQQGSELDQLLAECKGLECRLKQIGTQADPECCKGESGFRPQGETIRTKAELDKLFNS